jgi:hypothetical protein
MLSLILLASVIVAQPGNSWEKRLEEFLKKLGFQTSGLAKVARTRGGADRLVATQIFLRDSGRVHAVASCDGCYSPARWSDSSAVLLSRSGLIEVNVLTGAVTVLGPAPAGARELLAGREKKIWYIRRDNSKSGCSYSIWTWDAANGAVPAGTDAPCLPATDLADLSKPGSATPPLGGSKERFDAIWLTDSRILFLEQ